MSRYDHLLENFADPHFSQKFKNTLVECATLNYEKRFQSVDLTGKVALVTGARVKIGFQTTIKLLVSGATVIATSRFPQDCADRFRKHPEFPTFEHRLHIYGIDFRDMVHLEHFLDFIVAT